MKNKGRVFVNICLIFIFLFSLFQFQPPKPPTQAQSTNFSVSGHVTDGFGNGLAGVTVFADPKFKVFLPLVSSSSSAKNITTESHSQIQFLYSAVTDADGYYTINDIHVGTFILQVDMPGVTFNPEKREITAETTGSQDFDLHISDPIITPETVVLTDLSNQYLDGATYDGSTFYFTQMTSELEQVDVGDIIVSDVSAVDPDGYFRKVSALAPQGSGVLITTIPATLDESIVDGSVFAMETLHPSQIRSMTALDGVSLLSSPDSSSFSYYLENVVIIDLDGDPFTSDDQLKVNGSIEFETEFVAYLDMQGSQVMRFSMTNIDNHIDTLEFYSELELASLEENEVILASHTFSPITLMVGPLPIVFVPKLDLVVGVDGSVKVGFSAEVSHEFSMRSGIQYRYSSGWSPIGEVTDIYSGTLPQVTFQMTLKGYCGARFNLYLYGLAGPFVKITPYLQVKVEPLEQPWWTLYGGIDVPVGFRAHDYLDKILDLDEYEVFAIGRKQVIAQATVVDPSEMVFVPAGEFQMGCDPNHNGGYGCGSDEFPLHTVYLDAFYIDSTEVSNAQYAQCVDAGACDQPLYNNSKTRSWYYGNPVYDAYPVIYVSWYDAEDYCSWAGKRLPTEAEWEKAARGTTVRAYTWGDGDPNCSLANSYNDATGSYCVGDTSEVGSYPAGASPYGALDIAGNVWEWVNDWYSTTYYSESPYANPHGPVSGTYKDLRGGSWDHNWEYLRVAGRGYNVPNLHISWLGFRCVSSVFPDNDPPYPPSNPTPPDQATSQPLDIMLGWSGSDPDGDLLVYDVYLDSENSNPTTKIADHQTSTDLSVGPLLENTTYYWKVVAYDEYGASTAGPVWHFTTQGAITPGEMVFIPAGEFQMGCDPEHNWGYCYNSEELPLHTVYLDSYYFDQTEVTNLQYAQCVAAGACEAPSAFNSKTRQSYYDNPIYANYPVIYVDWYKAEDYCTYAGKRLPTEAEWEKAARGTSPQAYPWGDDAPDCSKANYIGCVGDTVEVSSFPSGASLYGVLNMAGNVWEWVNDWYSSTYYLESPHENPPGPDSGNYKVLRGGAWDNIYTLIRTPHRNYPDPTYVRYNTLGIRCASSLPPNNTLPNPPSTPIPPDKATNQSLYINLNWSGSDPDGDMLVYDVFLDAENVNPTTKIADRQTATELYVGPLEESTTYYWKVVSLDEHGSSSTGPVWYFITTDGNNPPPGMVFVPAGEFQMGCPPAHNGGWSCGSDELPLHTVYLDAYYFDQTEVTNAQYSQCVAAGVCNPPLLLSSWIRSWYYGNPEYDNYPVIYVPWTAADDYCNWAGKRLPTEAEWEKAARGTSPQAYPWGDEAQNCSLANSSGCLGDTNEVGSYPAGDSPFHALDMAGNVFEWVNDWYSNTYYSESPYENPSGPIDGPFKVVRGGSFFNGAYNLRSAQRSDTDPGLDWIGFRCVLPAP